MIDDGIVSLCVPEVLFIVHCTHMIWTLVVIERFFFWNDCA